jgi:transcriptional regulator with XRE-family HTH domain
MKEEFKIRLKKAMDAHNMKAVELCEKTGIPKGAVSYYLSGKSVPKADRLYLICKVLDVSEAWLLGYDVPMARSQEQKNNDTIASIVVELKTNNEFFDVVEALRTDPEFMAAVLSIRNLAVKGNGTPNN